MSHNVKVKYYARENTKVGTHSFYAQPIPNGTYGFERLCEAAAENTTIEAHTIRAAVLEYMKVAKARLLDGFRVEVGDKFVTLYPNLRASVADTKNEDGSIKKAATADDLRATTSRSRVGATVNAEFSRQFALAVSWQKVDPQTGAVFEDDDDATLPNDDSNGGSSSGLEP